MREWEDAGSNAVGVVSSRVVKQIQDLSLAIGEVVKWLHRRCLDVQLMCSGIPAG